MTDTKITREQIQECKKILADNKVRISADAAELFTIVFGAIEERDELIEHLQLRCSNYGRQITKKNKRMAELKRQSQLHFEQFEKCQQTAMHAMDERDTKDERIKELTDRLKFIEENYELSYIFG